MVTDYLIEMVVKGHLADLKHNWGVKPDHVKEQELFTLMKELVQYSAEKGYKKE